MADTDLDRAVEAPPATEDTSDTAWYGTNQQKALSDCFMCELNRGNNEADRGTIWKSCAYDDKSMELGKQSEYVKIKLFGYRVIADLNFENKN